MYNKNSTSKISNSYKDKQEHNTNTKREKLEKMISGK